MIIEDSNNISNSINSIGKNFKIGGYCIIEEGVTIGDNVTLGNYVYLQKGTIVGNDTFLDSYVRSSGNNYIGNKCTIRYGATIARKVKIGDEVFISPNVMTIFDKQKIQTIIQDRVFIGTAAVIDAGVYINFDIQIGAMSYVNKDCLTPAGVYFGQPAKFVGERK